MWTKRFIYYVKELWKPVLFYVMIMLMTHWHN